MFSNDRLAQLEQTVQCLRQMTYYEECQRTLVVDGKPLSLISDFDTISVPRLNNKFCWSNMWAAGVNTARNDVILYLDSDRLLPPNYLELVLSHVKPGRFVFTSLHYMMLKDLPLEECVDLLKDPHPGVFMESPYLGTFRFEPRYKTPVHGPGKNVMSGNTAFCRKTFLQLGGVDPWYCGHGAFADTDFHMQAASMGCKFVDLQVPELHCNHHKLGDDNVSIEDRNVQLLGLENFIYYCHKWNLPIALAESLAFQCNINDPRKYVRNLLKQIVGNSPRDFSE